MDRLSSVLPKILQRRGLKQLADASTLILRANEWIAAHMGMQAAVIGARTFADGTLFIEAENGIALSEMSRKADALLTFLKTKIPEIAVQSVRCTRSSGKQAG